MRLTDLRDGEITTMGYVEGACATDMDGDTFALVQRGHRPPWDLRREAEWDHGVTDRWPRRTYMRDIPWSILYPDDPPCDRGEEAVLWDECKRTDGGAVPVTLLRLD